MTAEQAPWKPIAGHDGFYQSTHDPAFELMPQAKGWCLADTRTGRSWDITGEHGLHYALDLAEGIVHDGNVKGAHSGNILHGSEQDEL